MRVRGRRARMKTADVGSWTRERAGERRRARRPRAARAEFKNVRTHKHAAARFFDHARAREMIINAAGAAI